MKIETLRTFDGLTFGSSPAVLNTRSNAAQQKVNAMGEAEFSFGEVVFRFVADKFVEASFKTPDQLEIDGEVVAANSLLSFMKARDKDYFEAFGFGVAPHLGLAYDLEHDGCWTTAFVEGRWDEVRNRANQRMHRTPR